MCYLCWRISNCPEHITDQQREEREELMELEAENENKCAWCGEHADRFTCWICDAPLCQDCYAQHDYCPQHRAVDGINDSKQEVFEMVYPEAVAADKCTWTHYASIWDGDNVWYTSCENAFELIDGTPGENKMVYCPYCGKQITETEVENE
jgi:uncharacterized Zn-finger protein